MNKVNKNACIQLHKLIDSGDEKGAINLINSEKDIDVSYEYDCCIPIFSAFSEKMYGLAEVIINHPTFNPLVENGFGEMFCHISYLQQDCRQVPYNPALQYNSYRSK